MDYKEFLTNLNENLKTKAVEELQNEELVLGIVRGHVKFLSVVESLEEVLTHEHINIRERGIGYLSWVVSQFPVDFLNSAEISTMINFYCDCLKGNHNWLPATIRGLLAVVKMKHILKEDLVKILVHLFQHVNCTTQLPADRFNIYCILKTTVENHLEDVRQMGPDFAFGLLSFIEGEIDPKNLYTIFNFLPLFINQFDLKHLSEELFEVLSCYFPVDFNTAAKDNVTITREDLATGLLNCLTGNESFCEQCLPMIFEKLASNFKTAKLDSYKLLQKCCKRLKVKSLEKDLSEFWKNVQKDVLPGNDEEICEAGLAALTDVIGLLSKEEKHNKILLNFFGDIIQTIKSLASRVEENMFQSAMRVLVAASTQSKITTSNALYFLKPFYQSVNTKTTLELKIILSSLSPFLKFSQIYKMEDSDNIEDVSCCNDLVNLFFSAGGFDDYEVRRLAFIGISEIIPELCEEFRKKVFDLIIQNIKSKEDIRTSAELLNVLRQLGYHHPKELREALSNSIQISSNSILPYTAAFLWTLSLIADLPHFTEYSIEIILEFIISSPYYCIGLESFLNACRLAKKNNSICFFQKVLRKHDVLQKLLLWWQKCVGEDVQFDEKVVIILSESLALITRSQDLSEQQIIVNKFIEVFKSGLLYSNSFDNLDSPAESLLADSSVKISQEIIILEAILGSVKPEIIIPDVLLIANKLINAALTSANESTLLSSSRLLASFVNKSEQTLALDLLIRIVENIFKQLEKTSDVALKFNCGILFTWVIKGVILRGEPDVEESVSKWFDLLGREDVGQVVAEKFGIVLIEDELYLNWESHCNIRVLYRQRLFGYFSKLLNMYEISQAPVKMNYLLALARLLQGIPNHLIQTEISSVVIVLVRCLDTDKPEVLLTALDILTELLKKQEKILADYIISFVPRLLHLSKFVGYMQIRIKALKCLFFYGFYQTFALLPLKNKVIYELEFCLDDKKRLVRKEAVRARCRWFLVGAPGENALQS